MHPLPMMLLGLFALSASALALLLLLKPQDSAFSREEAKSGQILHKRTPPDAKPRPEEWSGAAPRKISQEPSKITHEKEAPTPQSYPEELWDGPAGQGVELLEKGRIRLSEEQSQLLKGASSWGGVQAEARALIDSIPAEAFTSDW